MDRPNVSSNDTGVVVWVLGRAPNTSNMKFKTKLHQLLGLVAPHEMGKHADRHSTKRHGRSGRHSPVPDDKKKTSDELTSLTNETSSLLIILCAENQSAYEETSPRVIPLLADPFASFWQHWYEYFRDHPYVQLMLMRDYPNMKESERRAFGPHYMNLKLPRLRIYHHVTWSEVIASAFIAEDRERHELAMAFQRADAYRDGNGNSNQPANGKDDKALSFMQGDFEGNKAMPLIKHVSTCNYSFLFLAPFDFYFCSPYRSSKF
jgi:hypothetical protein